VLKKMIMKHGVEEKILKHGVEENDNEAWR
jgi:hypothetical protein